MTFRVQREGTTAKIPLDATKRPILEVHLPLTKNVRPLSGCDFYRLSRAAPKVHGRWLLCSNKRACTMSLPVSNGVRNAETLQWFLI